MFKDTDLLLVHRDGVDYKVPASELLPEAPDDGNVYVRNGQSKSWIRGLPYDVRTLPEL